MLSNIIKLKSWYLKMTLLKLRVSTFLKKFLYCCELLQSRLHCSLLKCLHYLSYTFLRKQDLRDKNDEPGRNYVMPEFHCNSPGYSLREIFCPHLNRIQYNFQLHGNTE